jgi:hypothetical protein
MGTLRLLGDTMTTLNSTDADPTPAHLTTSPAPDDPRPPAAPDSSTIGAGAPLTAESHLRIGGELAGRLLRSTRWQQ